MKKLLIAACAFFALSGVASAENFGGLYVGGGGAVADGEGAGGAFVGYDHEAIDGLYVGGRASAYSNFQALEGRVGAEINDRFLPYLSLGVVRFDADDLGDDTALIAGIGVEYAVNDRWAVDASISAARFDGPEDAGGHGASKASSGGDDEESAAFIRIGARYRF